MRKSSVAFAVLLWSSLAGAADVISLEVLPCGKPGVAGGLAAGPDLARMTVDSSRHPNAICNDGSPAVYYIRPYRGEESRDKWLIMLQGGGSCGNGQECAERWCSVDTAFGMDKMTSTLTKPFINGGGILTPEVQNQFGTWNTVLLFYCSSDGWSGRKSDVEYSATNGAATVNYRLHYRGADIIDAVVDHLRHPPRTRGARIGNSLPSVLPDLDDATDVLFAGASAGGTGVSANADRIGELLRATNRSCGGEPCLLDYRVAIDSSFPPDQESRDFSTSTYCEVNDDLCTYEGFVRKLLLAPASARNAIVDASCLAYHQTVEPGTEYKCADVGHVRRHHITTPMFIGQDEQDPNVGERFVLAGFGTPTDFGHAIESELRALATLDGTAEEGSALTGMPLARPGAWGPQCGGHELLGSNKDFFRTLVEAGGTPLSYHDIVWNWWSGASPPEAIREFTPPGAAPDCP